MSNTKRFIKKYYLILANLFVLFAGGITIFALAKSSIHFAPNDVEHVSPEMGVHYIQTVEAISANEIEDEFSKVRLNKQLDAIREALEEDPDEVWKELRDLGFVAMGDSRVVGFDVFGYVDENRVLAEGGAVLSYIPEYYDWVEVLNPGILLISYGLNDVNHTWEWDNVYEYIDDLNIYMEELTKRLPNAYIYINSILPAQDFAILEDSNWGDIPAWNAAIRENCWEKGWLYFDMSDLADEYYWLYGEDGVHMQSAFYPIWARALYLQYLEDLSY